MDVSHADLLGDLIGEPAINEIYLRLFNLPGATVADLEREGFTRETVDVALRVLAARELVTHEDDRWLVVPPSRSLPSLASRLEERAELIRTSLPGLTAAYRAAEAEHPGFPSIPGVEYLGSAQEVAFAVAQCLTSGRGTTKIMRRDSITTRRATFEIMPSLRSAASGPLEGHGCVTVIDTSLMRSLTPSDVDCLEGTPGERLLLSGHVPFTAMVSEDGVAVIEAELEDNVIGVLTHHPKLVRSVESVIDLVIETATAWPGTEPAGTDELTESERAILHLLSMGVPDGTIARRLAISTRTFDRRIRSILDKLGATTRFQAGVLAARKGWS